LKKSANRGEHENDISAILLSHGFSPGFSDAARREAGAIPERLDMRRARGRKDLRGERIFTIDGEDAKDLDDAVSIEPLCDFDPGGDNADGGGKDSGNPGGGNAGGGPNGDSPRPAYKLGVHIADVSAYVQHNSALDRDALRKGTSLYYADRVVPMLPKKLSNGVCSLHPRADRLALTTYMYVDGSGRVLSYEIFESVINASYRMTYENVRRILEDRDAALRAEYAEITGDLEHMRSLASVLRERRIKNGALDFMLRETKLTLDKKGKPTGVRAEETSFANQIIEEFMIACNETVASMISDTQLPFIYRTHEQPDPEKIAAFISAAEALGFAGRRKQYAAGRYKKPGELQAVLNAAQGTDYHRLLSHMLLRALAKAGYTPQNTGHFGLASDCYCHFTSPIRRYPDLFIHRVVKAYIKRGRLKKSDLEHYNKSLEGICAACSERERAADAAEREIEALKKAEYMKRFLGDTFDGAITGVTQFGMFVELANTVEGLVRVTDMNDDYYVYDGRNYTLTGKNSGRRYKIGDAVSVTLSRVNVENRQIDFVLSRHARNIKQSFVKKKHSKRFYRL